MVRISQLLVSWSVCILTCPCRRLASVFGSRMSAETENCVVCQEPYDTTECIHLACTHKFHKKCVENLMSNLGLDSVAAVRCPICRNGGADVSPPSPTRSELERLAVTPPGRLSFEEAIPVDSGSEDPLSDLFRSSYILLDNGTHVPYNATFQHTMHCLIERCPGATWWRD